MVSPIALLSKLASPLLFLVGLENWHETAQNADAHCPTEWFFFGSISDAELLADAGAEVYIGTTSGWALDLVYLYTLVGGNRCYYDVHTKHLWYSNSAVDIYALVTPEVAAKFEVNDRAWLDLEAA